MPRCRHGLLSGGGLAATGAAGFHLPLEPVDLILDRLPRGLGCQPLERSAPLFVREYRRFGQTLIEGDLLLGGRVRPDTGDDLAGRRRGRGRSGSRHGLGHTAKRAGLGLDHASLASLSCTRDDLRAHVARDEAEASVAGRLHGTGLIPVWVELALALQRDLLACQNPAHEIADAGLAEVLDHPAQVVATLLRLQQLTIGAALVLLAGHASVEVERRRLEEERL